MALVVCGAAVRAYTTSEPSAVLVDAHRALHAPTVAWLTEQQASSRATIKYIEAEPALPEAHLVQVAQQDDAAAPAKKRTLVCEAANKVLSSDNWCEILCEGNTTGAFTTFELSQQTHPVTLWQGGARAQGPKPGQCDPDYCECHDPSAPKEPLIKMVRKAEKEQLSGLPECLWMPPEGCTMESPYECLAGGSAGECSNLNWHDKPDECKSSCIHTKALYFSATAKEWKKGPVSVDDHSEVPHYKHDACKLTLEVRGIDVPSLDVLITSACKKPFEETPFVGITFFSPKYKAKAERLLRSCTRHGICCKATQAPDSFGSDAPEGSDKFRFQFIASKPAFILGQIKATRLPVVWLDSDLEFHQFPKLFSPGGWEDGPRDVAIFNYWGNETKGQNKPSTGSGVVYFNSSTRAKNLLVAWAEAMAFDTNTEAADDQVFNELLGKGWVHRASFGWLPSSYLRVPPLFYRGVVPVIDHDHGNPPGLIAHSGKQALMPRIGIGKGPMEWRDGGMKPANCTSIYDEPEMPDWQREQLKAKHKKLLKCKSTAQQITSEWCDGACNADVSDPGCDEFCECDEVTP
tara:strand:+ start:84 stop:1811 length:1728 start_codon:yes stop_codon:yes gene_type:complete